MQGGERKLRLNWHCKVVKMVISSDFGQRNTPQAAMVVRGFLYFCKATITRLSNTLALPIPLSL
jgi:hypothetical protein